MFSLLFLNGPIRLFMATDNSSKNRTKLITDTNSLEKDPARRASPWRMMEHPWMEEMKTKKVNMAHFLGQVWGWDANAKKG